MTTDKINDQIEKFLSESGFFAYKKNPTLLAEKIAEQFLQTLKPTYKRVLHINNYWENIKTWGMPRKIVAMDLGGTNLKIYEADIKNRTDIKIKSSKAIPFYKDIVYTPEILFRDLKNELTKFSTLKGENLKNLVFIFSYPIEQVIRKDGYIDAISTMITKKKRHRRFIGLQIGIAFQNYLRNNGYPSVNVSVTNDSAIFCLAGKAYEIIHNKQFDASINIIAGTGTNIAVACNKNKLTVINTEFGDFNIAPLSQFDKIINQKGILKNKYLTEKMISGAWIQDLLLVIIKELEKNKIISSKLLKNLNIDKLSPSEIEKILRKKQITPEQDLVLRYLWKEINQRGATICGIALANIIRQLQMKLRKKNFNVIIIETGSIIEKSYGFRKAMINSLNKELARLDTAKQISYSIEKLKHQGALGAVIFDTIQPHKNN